MSSAADRRAVAEGLAHYEETLRTRPCVKTWKDFLPESLRARAADIADDDPAAALRAAAASGPPQPLPPGAFVLSAEQIALLDATVRTAPPPAVVEKTPEELFPAVKPPPRKRAKRAPKGAAPAPAAPTVSTRAIAALEACWAMGFAGGANPFRTRLTKNACDALGVADYYDVVGDQVVDLALIKQRVEKNAYPDDAALREDVRRIAHNAAAYHGGGSDFAASATQLAAAYDATYASAR